MKGELKLVDQIEYEEEEFEISVSLSDFALSIYVDEEKTLEKQLKNRTSFDKCMALAKKARMAMNITDEDEEKETKYVEENFDNILDSVEYISLYFENMSVKEFIKNNPIVLTKKIIIKEGLSITDYDKLIRLMNEYKDIADKIYVSLEGNTQYVSLIDCYKTMNSIKKQADKIASLGLSPMETVMYVYDQVRNRVYKYENSDETHYKSRDLTEVIFGDKIVCLGYAHIFNALLEYLGIRNQIVHLDPGALADNDRGHARNIVYINDPKYNIDGAYYFDTTWDSKKRENNNSYLYSYKYFAKTKNEMDEKDKGSLEDKFMPMYSENFFEEVKALIEKIHDFKFLNYLITIKHMANLVGDKDLIHCDKEFLNRKVDKELFLKRLKKLISKFNREIPAETMIDLLNNVRKIEYHEDPEWYPYSIDAIYSAVINSKWKFSDRLDDEERLLLAIFGEELFERKQKTVQEQFINYARETNLLTNIEEAKSTNAPQKTLKRK